MNVYATTMDVLVPIVGRPAAEICVRSCAIRLGKSADTLDGGDLEELTSDIRRSMTPFASSHLVEDAIRKIRAHF